MRSSFPSSSSRVLVAAGTGALLVLVVIAITGGFVVQIGPIRVSARRWPAPLLIAAVAWLAAAATGRESFRAAAAGVATWVERHATALAVILAAAVTGAGVAYGTYSAAGADPAGYVTQAHLLAEGRLVRDVPLARETLERVVEWPRRGWLFAPLGYRPGAAAGTLVPTYPPGLPLLMAVSLVAGDIGPFLVAPFLAGAAVLVTYALGLRHHSRVAGLTAATLLATSPIVLFQVVQPMSDVPVAALWAGAVLLALTPAPSAPFAAGACAGFAILVRPNLLPFLLVVLLARPRLLPWLAGLVPAACALALVNWRLHGSPFASGYGDVGELFGLPNVLPNVRAYGERLLQGELPALVLTVVALVAVAVSRLKPEARGPRPQPEATGQRFAREATGRRRPEATRAPLAFAAVALAVVLACYLPYAVFPEWFYLRFLLPAFPLLFVAIGALVARAAMVLPAPARGLVLLSTLTVAASFNIVRAEREQAFNLHRYEARYRTAGRYLAASLPRNAVIVAGQQSASAMHYTGLPVLRWDALAPGDDVDAALAALRALGRQPMMVLDDWEEPQLRERFSRAAAARLDWRPRADVGDTTHVRVFDPADRGAVPRPAYTDRLR
jgi:hypothetical protein